MTVLSDVALPRVNVLGSTMAYREAGNREAPVALFLHGNPTSSYIWRKILPLVSPVAHCIAPDLIGFGQSGKPDIEYRFADHVRYLDGFLDQAGISSAFVIAQDWGTVLAFHLADRKPEFVRALAFMEFLRPFPTWDDFHPDMVNTFQKFRTPGVGEEMILEDNVFVERVSRGNRTKTDGGGNVCLQSALPYSQVTAAHLEIPERNSDRGRTGGRACDRGKST